MKEKIIQRFLVWLMYWGDLFDGIIGILSLGFIYFSLGYKISVILAKRKARETCWIDSFDPDYDDPEDLF